MENLSPSVIRTLEPSGGFVSNENNENININNCNKTLYSINNDKEKLKFSAYDDTEDLHIIVTPTVSPKKTELTCNEKLLKCNYDFFFFLFFVLILVYIAAIYATIVISYIYI
jgi:hypothetical protein